MCEYFYARFAFLVDLFIVMRKGRLSVCVHAIVEFFSHLRENIQF